jgi:hypothetical protein
MAEPGHDFPVVFLLFPSKRRAKIKLPISLQPVKRFAVDLIKIFCHTLPNFLVIAIRTLKQKMKSFNFVVGNVEKATQL